MRFWRFKNIFVEKYRKSKIYINIFQILQTFSILGYLEVILIKFNNSTFLRIQYTKSNLYFFLVIFLKLYLSNVSYSII